MKKFLSIVLVLILALGTVTASAEVLKYGSTGKSVSNLQMKLRDLGYYNGPIDGIYKDAMWIAVWSFQRENDLSADGVAGPKTFAALGGNQSGVQSNGLDFGARGNNVSKLQTALNKLGLYKGEINGRYNDATWIAVWDFQKSKGLSATGVADFHTLSILGLTSGADYTPYFINSTGLKFGQSGGTVLSLQKALKDLGLYSGALDGKYGDATWIAVWDFQKSKGISADGIAGAQTLALLNVKNTSQDIELPKGKTVVFGSKGASVSAIQRSLSILNLYKGEINGVYGDSTWVAVWDFQRSRGLSATGEVDVETWNLLVK